jgi:peroxiredoxin
MSYTNPGAHRASVRGASVDLPAAITNFYREEFIKHRQLLERQREYYSERAIIAAEAALTRTLARLEQLCLRENADIVVSDLLRQLDAVTNLSAWSDPKNSH